MLKRGRELTGEKKDRILEDVITMKTQGEREELLQKL